MLCAPSYLLLVLGRVSCPGPLPPGTCCWRFLLVSVYLLGAFWCGRRGGLERAGGLRLLCCEITGDPERGWGYYLVWTLRGFSWKQQDPDAEAVWGGGQQRDSMLWMLKNTWAQDVGKVWNEKTVGGH